MRNYLNNVIREFVLIIYLGLIDNAYGQLNCAINQAGVGDPSACISQPENQAGPPATSPTLATTSFGAQKANKSFYKIHNEDNSNGSKCCFAHIKNEKIFNGCFNWKWLNQQLVDKSADFMDCDDIVDQLEYADKHAAGASARLSFAKLEWLRNNFTKQMLDKNEKTCETGEIWTSQEYYNDLKCGPGAFWWPYAYQSIEVASTSTHSGSGVGSIHCFPSGGPSGEGPAYDYYNSSASDNDKNQTHVCDFPIFSQNMNMSSASELAKQSSSSAIREGEMNDDPNSSGGDLPRDSEKRGSAYPSSSSTETQNY